MVSQRRTSHREEAAILQAQHLLQDTEHRLLIEVIFHLQRHRGLQTLALIVQMIGTTCRYRTLKQGVHGAGSMLYLLLHTDIYLLPETRHTTHHRGANLFQRFLDAFGIPIDSHLCTFHQAHHSPTPLKDVGQRQEAHGEILVGHLRNTQIMCTHRLQIVGMSQYYPLGMAGSTRRINNGSDVFGHGLTGTDLHRAGRMSIITQTDEIFKIDGLLILWIQFHRWIINHQPLQDVRQLFHHDPSIVVLLLLAHEKRVDIRILHDESDLLRRTGRIHRHIG